MLAGELNRRTDRQLREALRFWEADRPEQLQQRFADLLRFLQGCGRLSPPERALVLRLLLEKRPLARHQLHDPLRGYPGGRGEGVPEGAVERLTSRMLVVLRRDRAQLTDRNDRLYLVEEAAEQLGSVPLMERGEFQRLLAERINTPGALTGCRWEELQDILLRGGFVELPPPGGLAGRLISRCHQQGLLEPVLVHDGYTFLPVLALASRALCTEMTEGHPPVNQSLYLYRLTMLADCLSCRNLDRKNRARNTELCLRETAGGARAGRYLEDLERMGVVRRRPDRLEVDASFATRGYREKLDAVESLLPERALHIREIMGRLGTATRQSLFSCLARGRLLDTLFGASAGTIQAGTEEPVPGSRGDLDSGYCGPSGGDPAGEREHDERNLEELLFRGFLVQDHAGRMLRFNDLHPTPPAGGSLIVNNDLEVLVYPERISFYTLHMLACFCRVEGEEQAVRLKIDRDTVTRGMAVAGDARRFVETLEACSRNPLDESVVKRVQQWAGRCATAGVRSRLVLELPTEEVRARFHRNSYLRRNLEREAGGLAVLSPRVDQYRLKRELRRENILAEFE
ncbi:MAG: hypothetical protein ACOC8N_06250 [Spirochaetota bacterium]